MRRGAPQDSARGVPDGLPGDLVPLIERIGAEVDRFLGGDTVRPAPVSTPPGPPLAEQRAAIDAELRRELERQGVIVGGTQVAQVVGAAVGKVIEWAG
jgi:hypothetical protein